MYLRVTERRNRDGSTVAYYALAENDWNAEAKRSETRVIHSFGRADQLDRAALQRLLASINRVIDADAADTLPTRGKTAVAEIEGSPAGTIKNANLVLLRTPVDAGKPAYCFICHDLCPRLLYEPPRRLPEPVLALKGATSY